MARALALEKSCSNDIISSQCLQDIDRIAVIGYVIGNLVLSILIQRFVSYIVCYNFFMQFSFKKLVLLMLVFSLFNSSYYSAVAASNLMPADCMMAMMDDGEDMMDCDCSVNGMQCQRCDADFLSASIAVVESKPLVLGNLNKNRIKVDHKQYLESINLARPSPPPIN